MNRRHLVVISVDALVYEDIANTGRLPLFHELIENGSLTKNVRTIYPSLTHPVHASVITGQPAGETGIIANSVFTPGTEDMPWYNRLSDIQCRTIFDLMHEAGLVSAACFWPVTAGAMEKIDYLIPELMDKDLEEAGGDVIRGFRNIGMSECLTGMLEKTVSKYGGSISHPTYDEVQIECASEIIRRYKPDILFTHPGFVDSERHKTGLFSPSVTEAVEKSEEWIGKLIQAAKDAGIYEDTDFIILSDHGQLPYSKSVKLNKRLIDAGLIHIDDEGRITDWDAYVQSCGLSALLYLKRPEDCFLKRRIDQLVEEWITNPDSGVGSAMNEREADAFYGLHGDFLYVLEASEDCCFSDEWMGEAITEVLPEAEGLGHASHGHRPEKGPQPIIIGFGPDFEKRRVIDGGNILSLFKMFKRILGV